MVLIPYICKGEESLVGNLRFQLRKIVKEDQSKPKTIRKKEIINMTAKIIDFKNRKVIGKPKGSS